MGCLPVLAGAAGIWLERSAGFDQADILPTVGSHLQSAEEKKIPGEAIASPGIGFPPLGGGGSRLKVRVRAPAAAVAAAAAEPDMHRSPGSPIRPGRSASPELAAEAAGAEEAGAEAAAGCRSYR